MKRENAESTLMILYDQLGDEQQWEHEAAADIRIARGFSQAHLATMLRLMSVLEYVCHGREGLLKSILLRTARLRLNLFELHNAGQPVDGDWVTMNMFPSLLDSLAASDRELTSRFAGIIGGRPALEKKFDDAFSRAFGYTLKYFIMADAAGVAEWLPKLRKELERKSQIHFLGYIELFEAIRDLDAAAAQRALEHVVQGHRQLSKPNRKFGLSEDSLLCVWGLGMANLARWYGLNVTGIEPLIPQALLCDVAPAGSRPSLTGPSAASVAPAARKLAVVADNEPPVVRLAGLLFRHDAELVAAFRAALADMPGFYRDHNQELGIVSTPRDWQPDPWNLLIDFALLHRWLAQVDWAESVEEAVTQTQDIEPAQGLDVAWEGLLERHEDKQLEKFLPLAARAVKKAGGELVCFDTGDDSYSLTILRPDDLSAAVALASEIADARIIRYTRK